MRWHDSIPLEDDPVLKHFQGIWVRQQRCDEAVAQLECLVAESSGHDG